MAVTGVYIVKRIYFRIFNDVIADLTDYNQNIFHRGVVEKEGGRTSNMFLEDCLAVYGTGAYLSIKECNIRAK